MRSANQSTIRRHNLALILDQIRTEGPLSRAGLAVRTGMPKVTVSSLVAELTARGLVREVAQTRGHVGRPATPVQLDGTSVLGLGLEIRIDGLAACLTDLRGEVRHRIHVPRKNRAARPEPTLDRLAELARSALSFAENNHSHLVGASVAVPGLVESHSGQVYVAPNLGWHDVPMGELLAQRLPKTLTEDLFVDNEANAAALAELHARGPGGPPDFVYVSLDVGVGAGVVMRGQLFRGAHGFGGELGHMTLDPEGPPCQCGNRGCLEALVGLDALANLARGALGGGLQDLNSIQVLRALAELAQQNNRTAQGIITDAGRWLALGLSAYANLFDPEAMILGGFASIFAPWWVSILREELSQRVLGARWTGCDVGMGLATEDASLEGSALSAVGRVFADPTLVPRPGPSTRVRSGGPAERSRSWTALVQDADK